MGKLNVKNGTPVGSEHLCRNCRNGQYVTGYRESDVLVICALSTPSFRLPFVVHECTDFSDKHRPDWKQMEKLAIHVQPVRVSKKTRGFFTSDSLQPAKPEYGPVADEEDDDEDEELEDIDAVTERALTP